MKKIVISLCSLFVTFNIVQAQNVLPPPILVADDENCFGFDCFIGDTYDLGTVLKLKQNLLRIEFDDTSASGGFPSNDWVLGANGTASGEEMFYIENKTAGTSPFIVTANALDSGLVVSNEGLRVTKDESTGGPILDLRSGDSPRITLNQDGTTLWPQFSWNIYGNESFFGISNSAAPFQEIFEIKSSAPIGSFTIFDNSIRLGNATTVSGNLFVFGDITVVSDRRLKKNIQDFESGLEKVMALKVKRYQYNHEKYPDLNLAAGNQIGLIAQEVAEIIPEVVTENPSGETFKTVNYVELVPVLIKAVQEQQDQLAQLEQENERLKQQLQRIDDLEAAVAKLLSQQNVDVQSASSNPKK